MGELFFVTHSEKNSNTFFDKKKQLSLFFSQLVIRSKHQLIGEESCCVVSRESYGFIPMGHKIWKNRYPRAR